MLYSTHLALAILGWQPSILFTHPSVTKSPLPMWGGRVILENGERLATVAAVREAENRLLSARGRPGGSTALALLQRIIGLAGQQCMPQARSVSILLLRREGDTCYSLWCLPIACCQNGMRQTDTCDYDRCRPTNRLTLHFVLCVL